MGNDQPRRFPTVPMPSPTLSLTPFLRALVIGLSSVLFLAACQTGPRSAGPVGAFIFDEWEGMQLRVHYVEPSDLPANAPVVIVMHGTLRNADDYRDNWIALAEQFGFRVYAPEFDAKRFPGAAGYNLGGAGEAGARAFDAIEPLYEFLSAERGLPDNGYFIFGHSAGGQFVHRFVCFANPQNLRLAISANAGWYTLPEGPFPWPYSLEGAPEATCDLADYFETPLLIALGDQDIDPGHRYLRRTPEALAQGPHRLARGLSFLETAKSIADARGLKLIWRVEIVEGIGHDNAGMAEAAARLVHRLATSTKDQTGARP